jgi:ribosomal protein S27E
MVKVLKVGKTARELEKIEADQKKIREDQYKKEAIAFLEAHTTLDCRICGSVLGIGIEDLETEIGIFYFIRCPNCGHNNRLDDYEDYKYYKEL